MGMLDRAGGSSNELFRFSTKDQKWEQLDATRVSGSPPSARMHHSMVSVGSDFFVFGGNGEEGLCDDGHRLGACQIERPGDTSRVAALLVSALLLCLLTLDGTVASSLSWHRESHGGADKHMHSIVSSCDSRFICVCACWSVQVQDMMVTHSMTN